MYTTEMKRWLSWRNINFPGAKDGIFLENESDNMPPDIMTNYYTNSPDIKYVQM